DPNDATCSINKQQSERTFPERLRFGIIKEYQELPGLDPEVKNLFDRSIHELRTKGHEIVELSFPYLDFLVPVYYVLSTAEASSNLSRFDGVHYGRRSATAEGIDDTYVNSRTEGFGEEVKRRIITGTFVLSSQHYDAYYSKGQKVRRLLLDSTNAMLQKVDCVVTPTTPTSAFELGAIKDPIQMYLQDIYTVHANLTGNPAINIPLGKSINGLPFGLQLMTNHFDENLLFHTSRIIANGNLNTVAQTLHYFYSDYANSKYSDSIIAALNYESQFIPEFSDEIYCQRLEQMNNRSPFGFDCNSITLNSIRNFAQNRRSFVKIVLGRSALYFDLFEEKLSEYGLPLELKYLACIESGLRPQIKSRAGALGLWQFMYRTGLYYGLEETSYLDERMDPAKATDAACRFLKKLYGIYGDWNLALAAYNAGPGTINKALQRSGNKKSYWDIRPYLP
ncbi:MAG: hypothetical protein EB023_13955, partial [Flavobacteriia bacterium]|nr:hypothetical protein [Flavobacteriia bacterium]